MITHYNKRHLSLFFLMILVLCIGSSCATRRPMWAATISPSADAVMAAMEQDPYFPYRGDIKPTLLPQFEPPMRLRPCCVFGMDVKVSVKTIPIPIYQVVNIVDREHLGPHTYDAGFFGGYGTDRTAGTKENNGVLYTCKGGFIDTAHVRDYADLTVFLFFEFFRNLGTSFDIELKGELGPRVIRVDPVDIKGDKFERARVATVLASWTAFQLSLWHEIAQWHGYSEFTMFSEEPSAYSLEDAYSNLLGITIANGLIYSALLFNDNQYARNFDSWLQSALKTLGSVPEEESRRYMTAVDGLWWDSKQRLPEKFIVLKRNYSMSHVQVPFLASDIINLDGSENFSCGPDTEPNILVLQNKLYDTHISKWVHIKLHVADQYRPSFTPGTAFKTFPDAITPDEYQAIADADEKTDTIALLERIGIARDKEQKSE